MTNANTPAFPAHTSINQIGLSKREYFAGQALLAAIAHPGLVGHLDLAAAHAVKAADALLAELAKGE